MMTDQGLDELLDLNPPGMTADEAAGRANAHARVVIPDTERVDDPSLFREPEASISAESLSGLGSWLLSVATSLLVVETGWVELSDVSNTYIAGIDSCCPAQTLISDLLDLAVGFQGDHGAQDLIV